MPARSTWKGYLKISLVNIPIKVFPATEASATISFNQLHGECQTRIQQKKWCPHCEREISNSEVVKGYEYEKGHWVKIEEEDFEKVRSNPRISLQDAQRVRQREPWISRSRRDPASAWSPSTFCVTIVSPGDRFSSVTSAS